MNIFALSIDVQKAARWHVDKHVVKMPSEIRQMLSTAVRMTYTPKEIAKLEKRIKLWKSTHPNHPSTAWARESLGNWYWLRALGLALLDEHFYRYGRRRDEMYEGILALPEPRISKKWMTPFSLAMPDWIKEAGLPPVTAYRVFYANEKSHLFRWTGRNPPEWLPNSVLSDQQRMTKVFGGIKER